MPGFPTERATLSAVNRPDIPAMSRAPKNRITHNCTHNCISDYGEWTRTCPDQKVRLYADFREVFGRWRTTANKILAEGVGFEPTIRLPVYTLSKRAPSATRPSLRTERCK